MRAMYNEKQKQQYLKFEKTNADASKRYFQRIYHKEKEYNKDIADMTAKEILDTISSLNIRREESRGHFISIMRWYVNWAVLNGMAKSNDAINSVSPGHIDSNEVIRNTMIKSPEQIRSILDNALDYEFYENRSIRDELIIWLLYCGISLEDFPSLKKTDLDYNSKTVTVLTGKGGGETPAIREFKISDDHILDLWVKCSKMTYIEKRNGKAQISKNKDAEEYTKYDLIDNDYLFRPIEGKKGDSTRKFAMAALRNIVANLCRGIPARNLNFSGTFYRLYMLECSGVEITPEIIAKYFYIDYKTNKELFARTRKWRIDYGDWKYAFGLS